MQYYTTDVNISCYSKEQPSSEIAGKLFKYLKDFNSEKLNLNRL